MQTSARLAWKALEGKRLGSDCGSFLFCYGPGGEAASMKATDGALAKTRREAIWKALAERRRFRSVLIWHLGLLPLLPFFRARNAAVAVFLHGIECWRRLSFFERKLLERVAVVLSNSEHTWARFAEWNPEVSNLPHRVVPLGTGAPAPAAAPPGDPPAVLMVGRLSRAEDYKGHRETIAAWDRVLVRLPGAELWVAGEGDLRPELEGLARDRGVAENVRFLGEIGEARKQELLARSRCLALPSRGEGFGLVYAEAMRMGRPCLVSTSDAGREVVNPPEAGLAVDPRAPEETADALVRMMTLGSEWSEWSENARARYERLYTEERFQTRLLEALCTILPALSGREAERI